MIDKRKIRLLVIGGIAAVILIIVLLVQGLSNRAGDSLASGSPTESASASASQPEITLSSEEKYLLLNAGTVAAKYDTNPEFSQTPDDYIKAGFSDSLAQSYRPIWEGLFAGRTDQVENGAKIGSQTTSSQTPEVVEYSGAKPGTYTLKVAVKVDWRPLSVKAAPGKEDLLTFGKANGTATWTLTYDQLSQRVIAVDQPAWQDLDAATLFEALNMPVPTATSKETNQ